MVSSSASVGENPVPRGREKRLHVNHGVAAGARFGNNKEPIVDWSNTRHCFGCRKVGVDVIIPKHITAIDGSPCSFEGMSGHRETHNESFAAECEWKVWAAAHSIDVPIDPACVPNLGNSRW